ncbi:MAG: 4-hydroxythreonine-4-phosphate dehydrogenase PdxA, partial [Mariprofundaceae bacterium]
MQPLLVTVGEPAGIGPDCILRLFHDDPTSMAGCVIAAPAVWLNERAESIALPATATEQHILSETPECGDAISCWNPLADDAVIGPVRLAHPSAETAEAVVACIREATAACITGKASGMVTGPIEKAVLKNSGFAFPGHTEYLAHLAGDSDFVMMLASDELRVALLTTHMALGEVSSALSTRETLACLEITARDLEHRFGITRANIGLCALNPHAGEQGHFGDEEIRILGPAAEAARLKGIHVTGPLPADTIFSVPVRSQFDAVVCCYHD